ncbi:MAG: 4-hydroxy-3-methylbut-2-enyl diphosphate reductase [Bacilli bacterium]
MEVKHIVPQGFCKGVIKAMMLTSDVLSSGAYPMPLYMLGSLVHNKHIMNAYKDLGIQVISSLDGITQGSVIITAHGASDACKKDILSRGLTLIDATCQDVAKTHTLIQERLSEGYQILFFGKRSHPETRGILGISSDIILIESLGDIASLSPITKQVALMVQTTMSTLDLADVLRALKTKYPTIALHHDVCDATKRRQFALLQGIKDVDLVIVVGDPMSNNTQKLRLIAKQETDVEVLLIESINDLLNYDFKNIHKVALTAGASTPPAIVEEIEEGLQHGLHPSTLTACDYLKTKKTRA